MQTPIHFGSNHPRSGAGAFACVGAAMAEMAWPFAGRSLKAGSMPPKAFGTYGFFKHFSISPGEGVA